MPPYLSSIPTLFPACFQPGSLFHRCFPPVSGLFLPFLAVRHSLTPIFPLPGGNPLRSPCGRAQRPGLNQTPGGLREAGGVAISRSRIQRGSDGEVGASEWVILRACQQVGARAKRSKNSTDT